MKNKQKGAGVDYDNPALYFMSENTEIYKYFDELIYAGNIDAFPKAKKIIEEIKEKISKVKKTSRTKRTVYVVKLIVQNISEPKTLNFEIYEHNLDVLNIDTEYRKVKESLAKVMKRIRTLETCNDYRTKYRFTIISFKKYRANYHR